MSHTQIAIYGAGGFGREVAWLVQSCNTTVESYEVVCFIDDNEDVHNTNLNGIPIIGLVEAYTRFPKAKVVGGIGAPQIRQTLMEKAAIIGFDFATIIHPHVEYSEWVKFDKGTIVCAGNILTVNINLKKHVQINLDCTIGHDVVMNDYVTLAPGVHISGNVQLGKRVYVGTGAVIINGDEDKPIIVEDDAVIGAGACVTRSVSSGQVVVGVPARPLQAK